jgi:hypothetical protein
MAAGRPEIDKGGIGAEPQSKSPELVWICLGKADQGIETPGWSTADKELSKQRVCPGRTGECLPSRYLVRHLTLHISIPDVEAGSAGKSLKGRAKGIDLGPPEIGWSDAHDEGRRQSKENREDLPERWLRKHGRAREAVDS